MRRPRPGGPIEDRRCYGCGVLGHLSYDCPKRQVEGKFANVTRSNHPSYDEPGEDSSDESDVEEISERGYEKDDYEVEVQAFMVRGQKNGRKGRKHGKPGEGGKKEPLWHNLPPRYDRQ